LEFAKLIADFCGGLVVLDPDGLGKSEAKAFDLILRGLTTNLVEPSPQRQDFATL
jgi:hypothetical protein